MNRYRVVGGPLHGAILDIEVHGRLLAVPVRQAGTEVDDADDAVSYKMVSYLPRQQWHLVEPAEPHGELILRGDHWIERVLVEEDLYTTIMRLE